MPGNSGDVARGSVEPFQTGNFASGLVREANEGSQVRLTGPSEGASGILRAPGVMFRAPVETRLEGPGVPHFGIGSAPPGMMRGPSEGNFMGSAVPPAATVANSAMSYNPRGLTNVNEGPGLLGPMPSAIRAAGVPGVGLSNHPQSVTSGNASRMPVQGIGNASSSTGMPTSDHPIGGNEADRLVGTLRGIMDNMRGPTNVGGSTATNSRLGGFPGNVHGDAVGLSNIRNAFGNNSTLDKMPGGLGAYNPGSNRSEDDGLPVARELLRNQLSAVASQSFRPMTGPEGGRLPVPSLLNAGEHQVII
jgi:hypothetical protein